MTTTFTLPNPEITTFAEKEWETKHPKLNSSKNSTNVICPLFIPDCNANTLSSLSVRRRYVLHF